MQRLVEAASYVRSIFRPAPAGPQPEKVLTRLEKIPEMKKTAELLAKLHDKKVELDKAKQAKGKASIDAEKFKIVEDLLTDLDARIDQFNRATSESSEEEIKAAASLATNMEAEIMMKKSLQYKVLNTFRKRLHHQMYQVASGGVYVGTWVAIWAVPVGGGVGAVVGKVVGGALFAKPAKDGIMYMSGLSDDKTRTVMILDDLEEELHKVNIILMDKLQDAPVTPETPAIEEAPAVVETVAASDPAPEEEVGEEKHIPAGGVPLPAPVPRRG